MLLVRYDVHPELGSSSSSNNETPIEYCPATDVREDASSYWITIELPGVAKEDVEIALEEGVLKIAAVRRQNPKEGFHYLRSERVHGRLVRKFAIPDDVDSSKAEAELKDGLLTVHLPKSESRQPRLIEIKAA